MKRQCHNTKEMAASSIYLHFFTLRFFFFFLVAIVRLLAALHTACKLPHKYTTYPWNQSMVHCTPLQTIHSDCILKNATVYFLQI